MGTPVKLSSITSHHQAWFVTSYICSKLTRSGKVCTQIHLNLFFLPKKSREDFSLNHKHSILYTPLSKIRGFMSEESQRSFQALSTYASHKKMSDFLFCFLFSTMQYQIFRIVDLFQSLKLNQFIQLQARFLTWIKINSTLIFQD